MHSISNQYIIFLVFEFYINVTTMWHFFLLFILAVKNTQFQIMLVKQWHSFFIFVFWICHNLFVVFLSCLLYMDECCGCVHMCVGTCLCQYMCGMRACTSFLLCVGTCVCQYTCTYVMVCVEVRDWHWTFNCISQHVIYWGKVSWKTHSSLLQLM